MRVPFPCLLVALSLIAITPALDARAAEDCDTPNSDMAQLRDSYGKAYKKSDSELNTLYKQIMSRLKDDEPTTKLLVTAQKAWVAFRDAECDFSTSRSSGGTIYPMIQAICLDKLTSKRVGELKTYLKCQEGDMDCPVPAQ